jgi:TetR/AcrR family transcriptional regulator
MASKRRLGLEDSTVRTAIIDAAAQVLQEKGFVALTSQSVANRAGLKPQLVYYYFRTMDDLVVALVRRGGDYSLARIARAVTSKEPIEALWEQESDRRTAALAMELLAMGIHHQTIQVEVVRYAEQGRRLQAEAIAHSLKGRGRKPPIPPMAIAIIMAAVGRLLARERTVGMTLGHREMKRVINDWLLLLTSGRVHRPKRTKAVGKRPGRLA